MKHKAENDHGRCVNREEGCQNEADFTATENGQLVFEQGPEGRARFHGFCSWSRTISTKMSSRFRWMISNWQRCAAASFCSAFSSSTRMVARASFSVLRN